MKNSWIDTDQIVFLRTSIIAWKCVIIHGFLDPDWLAWLDSARWREWLMHVLSS